MFKSDYSERSKTGFQIATDQIKLGEHNSLPGWYHTSQAHTEKGLIKEQGIENKQL